MICGTLTHIAHIEGVHTSVLVKDAAALRLMSKRPADDNPAGNTHKKLRPSASPQNEHGQSLVAQVSANPIKDNETDAPTKQPTMDKEAMQGWILTFDDAPHLSCFSNKVLQNIRDKLPEEGRPPDGTLSADKVYQALCVSIAKEEEDDSSAQLSIEEIIQNLRNRIQTMDCLYWLNRLQICLNKNGALNKQSDV